MKYPMGWLESTKPNNLQACTIDAGLCPVTNQPMEIVALNMFDRDGKKTTTYVKVNVEGRVVLPLTNEELTSVIESTQTQGVSNRSAGSPATPPINQDPAVLFDFAAGSVPQGRANQTTQAPREFGPATSLLKEWGF